MRMLIVSLCLAMLAAGCANMQSGGATAERQDVLYSCNCGPDCKCNTLQLSHESWQLYLRAKPSNGGDVLAKVGKAAKPYFCRMR